MVIKKTVINAFSSSAAIVQAHGLWTTVHMRDNRRPDGSRFWIRTAECGLVRSSLIPAK